MSLVASLPDDIIYTLHEWLDKPTLIAMNMVSRQFYLATVSHVWAQIILSHSGDSWTHFESTIAALCNLPHRMKHVKWLRIKVSESFVSSEADGSALHRVSNVIQILQLSTGLRKLHLYLNRDRHFGRIFYQELAKNNFSFKLEECAAPGPFAPPQREFARFLRAMDSLRSLTMVGIGNQEYAWSDYCPASDDWPFLESIHFSNADSVALFIPGRLIRRITVWELDSNSQRIWSLINPVESVRTFKMLSWRSEHSSEGALALAKCLSELHGTFPQISTLLIGYWYTDPLQPGDGMELVPPMFTEDTTLSALGQFTNLRTLVCPIWGLEGETETGTYCAKSLLSRLHTHCPLLREAFLRRDLFSPSKGPETYESWSRVMDSDWEQEKWSSQEALAEYVDSL